MQLDFPEDYPVSPVKISFKTKIFHPNIKENDGWIGAEFLGEWKDFKYIEILEAIYKIMHTARDDVPILNNEAHKMSKGEFKKKAEEWTKEHAIPQMPKKKIDPKEKKPEPKPKKKAPNVHQVRE